jgi:uncharacterized protein YdeI (YjbR/CyaY-like superfamily)
MPKTDPRVDTYIRNSEDFARPILLHLRDIVHDACPDVEETMKWSFPHFTYKGILCSMASFKEHCTFGFWKGSLIVDDALAASANAMGQFGRIQSIDDLPPRDTIIGYVLHAVRLNEEGVRAPSSRKPRPDLPVPVDLAAALAENRPARENFDGFPPSHRREYIEWITEAKREATRRRRIETAVEWIAEGKGRNWKYER